jgi:hypothetical protein
MSLGMALCTKLGQLTELNELGELTKSSLSLVEPRPHQGGWVPAAGAGTCVQSCQKWTPAPGPAGGYLSTFTGTCRRVPGTRQQVPSAIPT